MTRKIIKIDQSATSIPVIIGELEFGFDVSDESLSSLNGEIKTIAEKMVDLDSNDRKAIAQIKALLKEGFDLLLGDGAFDEIYNVTPSSVVLMGYFAQIILQLGDAVGSFGDEQMHHANQYRKRGNKDYYNKASEQAKKQRKHNKHNKTLR